VKPARSQRRPNRRGSANDAVRDVVSGLPGVEEGTSYGTAAFRVRGKLFARFHQDGESLVVRAEREARDALLDTKPQSFFVTDHYRGHPWVLVRLGRVSRSDLRDVLVQAWRLAGGR
jgi:hypothetical protein